jgi:S-formylglutathione hydrolase FrmB
MKKRFLLGFSLMIFCSIFHTTISQSFNYQDTCFYSTILDQEKCIRVYLPPEYEADTTSYPVVYYLHGAGGNYEELIDFMPWINEMIINGNIHPMIFVGLDGRGQLYGGSMYTNSILNGDYEDYIIQEVIPFAESIFRTKNSMHYRCITGASMGGYGSMKLQLKHTDLFTGVASYIGPLQLDTTMVLWQPQVMAENTGPPYNFTYPTGMFTSLCFTVAAAFSPNLNILPYQVEFPYDTNCELVDSVISKWREHDCSHLAKNLDSLDYDNPGIFFACGTNDNLFLYPGNVCFEDTLKELGVDYSFYTDDIGHFVSEDMFRAGMLFLDSVMYDDVFVGIDEKHFHSKMTFSVYPNPVLNHLSMNIDLPYNSDIMFSLINTQGMEVKNFERNALSKGMHHFHLVVHDLLPGIYFIRIQTNKETIIKKLIKK